MVFGRLVKKLGFMSKNLPIRFLKACLSLNLFKLISFFIGFFSLLTLYGQTPGPAGVGTGDGSVPPRNVLWLRADAGVTESAGKVTNWADQSGNGLNAAQGTASEQPNFTASNSLLNNRPSINYVPDGVNAIRLVVPDNDLLDDGSGFSFFVAFYNNSTTGTVGLLNKRNGNNNQQSYRFYRDGTNLISNVGNSSNTVTLGGANVAGHILSAVYDGSLAGNKYFAFRNSNANSGSSNGNDLTSLPNTTSSLHIGNFNAGDARALNGDIAEVIIYKAALTAPERIVVENYLSQKYNIGIGTNDGFGNAAFYNASFFNDFSGIGSLDGTVKRSSAVSNALSLREFSNTLNANEFLMFAHDGTTHASGVTSNLGEPEITSRWARSWYLESTFNGAVDAGSIAAELVFDFNTAGLAFTGNPNDYVLIYRDDATGDFSRVFAQSYVTEPGNKLVVTVSANRLKTGYYTIALGTQLNSFTWYVFQDGNWSDPNTWTLDASVTPVFNNPGNDIPGVNDEVLIRSGRSVTIQPSTNNININGIEVRGTLNLTNSTGHDFKVVNGNGIILMAGYNPGSGLVDNFPAGNVQGNIGFADVNNGGTLVVSGSGNITLNVNRNFKNLRIDRANAADEVYLGADYLVRGEFNVRHGNFYFGDNTVTSRSLIVEGNVLIEDNGSTRIGRVRTRNVASAVHSFEIKGNFTNNGQAYFTNRANFGSDAAWYSPSNTYYTSDDNTGRVNVSFTNDVANQTAAFNNVTYFSRIVINKGNSSTYVLTLQANDTDYFRLLGRANYNIDSDVTNPVNNLNAFSLIAGTVRINTNVIIPVLNTVSNYSIPTAARLWVDGGLIRKTAGTAIVPYGAVEVSGGNLISTVNSGITIRGSGSLKVSGGSVELGAFRTSVQGASAQGTYEQSGGTVTVNGGSGINASYAVFSLTYPGNVFIMSGGTLTVRGRPNLGTDSERGTIFINADPSNQSVTGGRVIFDSNTTTEYRVTSRAPFFNVNMRGTVASAGEIVLIGTTSGTGAFPNTQTLAALPLRVLNNLTLEGNELYAQTQPVIFRPVTSGTNINDVFIGGSFIIDRNTTYIPLFGGISPYDGVADQPTAVNSTIFNQTVATSSIDTLYFGEQTNSVRLELGNFVLDRNSGNQLRTIGRSSRPNANIMVDVNGNASVESGTLDQNRFTFRIWGSIVNKDRMGTYFSSGTYPTASGTPSLAQIRFREDPPLTITTEDDAVFGNVRFNVGSATTIELTSDIYIERMEYLNGRIYAKNHTVTVDEIWNWNNGGGAFFDNDIANSSLLRVVNTGPVANIIVFTDGKASDGGLRVKVNGNTLDETETTRLNNTGPMTFPVGFTLDGGTTIYYRPAQLKVKDFTDDGYIRIRVVSGQLSTTALTGGEILRHYWRVSHDGFTTLPTVAFRFYYRNRTDGNVVDLQVGHTAQVDYVPGHVLDNLPFTRYFESDPTEDKSDLQNGPNTNTRYIVFNGPDNNAEFDQNDFTGFTLFTGNFTTGLSTRFVGAPTVYYSRMTNGSDWYNRFWENGDNWSLVPHDGAANNDARPAAGTWPQAGDIAVIGYAGFTGGISPTHSMNIANGNNINVAQILYNNPLSNASRLVINQSATLTFGSISGTGGTFMERPSAPAALATISGDFGDFYSSNTFTYAYNLNGNGTYNISPPSASFPNLRVEGGNDSRIAIFNADILVNGNFTVDGNTRVRTSNGISGNIEVLGELRIGGFLAGSFEFNDQAARTVTVGALNLRQNSGAPANSNLIVRNNTPSGVTHRLVVRGNIVRTNQGAFDLFNGNGVNDNNAILELTGAGNHSYTKTAGDVAEFYRVEMNKGNSTASSFTISEPFTLNFPANLASKPLEILNGLLVLDDPAIDINLSTGGGDFLIPNVLNPLSASGAGGLELRQGIARVSGANTGIILDGLLRISGGTLSMDGGAGVNNFIEYSSSGNAIIELSAGNLIVGSQLRRSTTATSGVLKYRQTGGSSLFAKNATPTTTRGAFEILNSGSEFTFTGGSFVVQRHVNSATVSTVRIEPDNFTIGGRAIRLGNNDTPINQNNFGIQSTITIDSITVGSANVEVKIYDKPLSVNTLNIITGGTFRTTTRNLTINTTLNNNGSFFTPGGAQITFFPSNSATTITGNGTTIFRNLEKSGSGTLTLSKDVSVTRDVIITGGVVNTQSFALSIARDLTINTTHTSSAAGPGIVFNGTEKQKLARSGPGTSFIGTMRLNNAQGLIIENSDQNFEISQKLVLENGVFDIGGNQISFTPNAVVENGSGGTSKDDFNVNRMIQTNSSINDFGVRKFFNAVSSGNVIFTFPVGLNSYTPVVVTVNDISASSLTIRPVADIPPVPEDTEFDPPTCLDPEITDADNVLQYYWIIKSSGVNSFNGMLEMYYDPSDVSVTAPYTVANYGPARLYNAGNTWDKVFTAAQFDELNQRIEFPFTGNSDATVAGIYTAGVTLQNDGLTLLCGGAIPDEVPEFITLEAVTTGNFYDDPSYQGGVAPLVGSTPDITVKNGFTLVLNTNSIRTRKITIEPGGILEVAPGTIGHNLGFVTGEGTIRLVSNTSFVNFPAGDYEDFFPTAACLGGGGLEYAGSGSYGVLAGLSNVRRLVFSGSGERTIPNNASIRICEDLDMRGTVEVVVPDGNSTITVLGNIYKSDLASFDNGGGDSRIRLQGASQQLISGIFTGLNALNDLEVDNAAGLTIVNAADPVRGISANADIDIAKSLIFSNGRIITNPDNQLRLLQSATPVNYSSVRYVNGPLIRQLPPIAQSFPFPIGHGNRYGLMEIVSPSSYAGVKDFTSIYFNATPPNDVFTLTAAALAAGIDNASGNEYWNVGAVSPASSNIRLYWDADSDVQSTISNLRIVFWNGTAWDLLTTVSAPSGSVTNGSLSSGPMSYSSHDITFATVDASVTPLPVEIISFKGELTAQGNLLKWETASEFNNHYFELERSASAENFEVIGKIEGMGTISQLSRYQFLDTAPLFGRNYYRLKQVDFDGKVNYVDKVILLVNEDGQFTRELQLTLFPNPAKPDNINVLITGLENAPFEISIYSLNGSKVFQKSYETSSFSLSEKIELMDETRSGLYIVRVVQGYRQVNKRLLVK